MNKTIDKTIVDSRKWYFSYLREDSKENNQKSGLSCLKDYDKKVFGESVLLH